MTQQTALDEFVEKVRDLRARADRLEADPTWYDEQYNNHAIVDCAAQDYPELFSQALQDPRYLAYCKEQDRKEEGSEARQILDIPENGYWLSNPVTVEY